MDEPYRGRGSRDHIRKAIPSWIQVEIPMRQIVWLVPQYNSFDHLPLPSAWME
jgi:hypothetical protein